MNKYKIKKRSFIDTKMILGALIGTVISIIFNSILNNFSMYPGMKSSLILISFYVVLISCIYISFQTKKEIEEIILNRYGTTNLIISEPDLLNITEKNYEGYTYQELEQWVKKAQKNIFVIPNSFRKGGILTWDAAQRESYFKAIEHKVKNNKNFSYTRIQQVPQDGEDNDLKKHFGTLALNHIDNLLKESRENISLMYIKNDEITGFMIIDDSIFIKFITGVTSDGKKSLIGITVQESRFDHSIREFINRISNILIKESYKIKKEQIDNTDRF